MSNLLASIRTAGDTLRTYEKGLTVTQNNIANASTPGYARAGMSLIAEYFDPDHGTIGGVGTAPIQSARSSLAERAVRRQLEGLGYASTQTQLLEGIEAAFPVSSGSGIPGALNDLLASFSSWSLTPNDSNARAAVLEDARGLARAFGDTATQLSEASRTAEATLNDTVSHINALVGQLRDTNTAIRNGGRDDAGLEALAHSTMEKLSELVDFTALEQADGTFTILAGGMVPLVIGDQEYPLSVDFAQPEDPAWPEGPNPARVLDAAGEDVTARIKGGTLGGTLDVRNRVLPGLIGSSSETGGVNRLAVAIAERVNGLLAAGMTEDDATPAEPLFQFDALNQTAAAITLTVNELFEPEMLAAIDPGPPYVSNGTALKLAGLGMSSDPADQIDGTGFTQFYAGMAERVGRQHAEAKETVLRQETSVAQARAVREEISGVSLDEEAILLLEYQRAYQAAAQLISVLDELTETAVNLLR
ncbi:MAG TPA: flagellar hook-associated protein FlgK [Bryobacteraceae bacterium]|nr:flagellar hook-associated protein FlgK [Bryobacteraceae bacterium]